MNCFDDGSIADMNISNGCGYIILDTTIRDDKHMWVVQQRHDSNIIKLVSVIFKIIVITFGKRMKGKMTGKTSIIQEPGENSIFKGSNEGKTSLYLLSMSMVIPLIFSLWQQVNELRKREWYIQSLDGLDSKREHKMWLWKRVCALNRAWPLILQKWRLMGIRPAIALTPNNREVWNMLRIQIVTLCCIWLSILSGYDNGALL